MTDVKAIHSKVRVSKSRQQTVSASTSRDHPSSPHSDSADSASGSTTAYAALPATAGAEEERQTVIVSTSHTTVVTISSRDAKEPSTSGDDQGSYEPVTEQAVSGAGTASRDAVDTDRDPLLSLRVSKSS